jgi:hypothetical protein
MNIEKKIVDAMLSATEEIDPAETLRKLSGICIRDSSPE